MNFAGVFKTPTIFFCQNNQFAISVPRSRQTASATIAQKAIAYGVTGPSLRGSGVKWDLRKDQPYLVYDKFDFNVPVGKGEMGTVGDCWDRYMVRMREIEESAKIVRQALDMLPEGETRAKVPKALKILPGEIFVRTEAPREEWLLSVWGARKRSV
jgi:NADH-quinone oxidoreductase subunit D